jgi:hypothetical protein
MKHGAIRASVAAATMLAVGALNAVEGQQADRAGDPSDRGHSLWSVQTEPGAAAEVRRELAKIGARVLLSTSPTTLVVATPNGHPSGLRGVVAVEPWWAGRGPKQQLERLTIESAIAAFPGGVPLVVGLAPATDLDRVSGLLSGAGSRVVWASSATDLPQLGIVIPSERLETTRTVLRRLEALVFTDLQAGARLRNSESVWRCQSGVPASTPVFEHGVTGIGQVIAITDTGLDIDHCQFSDDEHGLPVINDDVGTAIDPSHRKVLAVDFYWDRDWPDPGPGSWDDQGHGSHVAGSAAGDWLGDGLHQGFDGMAPAARLVIQDAGYEVNDCADLPGLGCPLRPLEPVLQQAYEQGARLHTNSWGDEETITPFNRYTERTADVDRFVWNHRDMLVLFAAGNSGPADDSVGSPATGKNVVAVGATARGNIDPPCVTVFSSRGWTHDGRIKPDVVAPGQQVMSTFSDGAIATGNCGIVEKSGTSMASPTAAGLAALVRQYFSQGYYPIGVGSPERAFAPSAALVKAMLIASAVDLVTLGCADLEPVPSRDQGWGMIELDRALYFPGDRERLFIDDHGAVFDSGAEPPVDYRTRVRRPGPLKVVLVWTDPPSTSLAEVNLINDLDLEVIGPDGRFLGNRMAGGVSLPGGEPDRLNNVEVVWLPEATPGDWAISVIPHQISEAGQDFALVVTGSIAPDDVALRPGGVRRKPSSDHP